MTATSIVSAEGVRGDLRGALARALESAEWRRFVPRGAPVSLKVNLGWDLFVPGAVTAPFFVEALIEAIRDHVGAIAIVESDQVLEDAEKAFRRSLLPEVCARSGARWVNMGAEPTHGVDAPDNKVLRRIEVPRILRETTLITVPVMKTHAKTGISGALKNQWGCLPRLRHAYHLVLDDALADLNTVIRPAFAVMDATIGLEGNGPKSGRPKRVDRVLCSGDPVALDAVQALTMGLDPASIAHLGTCAARGLGTRDPAGIEVRGLDPRHAALRFRPARHNAVSAIETLLRRSLFKRLFFDTPAFLACVWGAKRYYELWTWLNAGRCWRQVLGDPFYGPLWRPVYESIRRGR